MSGMATKGTPTAEVKRQLAMGASMLKRRLLSRHRRPDNLIWLAGELHGQILAAPPEARADLYWKLAVTYFAARRQDLAFRAIKLWRGGAQASEADLAMQKARDIFRRAWPEWQSGQNAGQ
jgi:hypothetical protein